MIDLLYFSAKTFVIAGTIVGIVALIALIIGLTVAKSQHLPEVQVQALHKNAQNVGTLMKSFTLDKDQFKKLKKSLKDEAQKKRKSTGQAFVLRFKGDIKASQTESLRQEISAIIQAADAGDEVILVLESPGGMVHGYGHAASQLMRIRQAGLQLTVCVDQVAASGGYMMASVAHQIIAAHFAIIGSVGVVAQVPNFHRVLKKNDVDFKEYTAGEFKRTVTLFGEITEKGEQKFIDQLEKTHDLFKKFITQFRPQLNLAEVATGEYWYGEQALALGLVDKIQTSDDYLLEKMKDKKNIFEVTHEKKKTLGEKVSEMVASAAERTSLRLVEILDQKRFFS